MKMPKGTKPEYHQSNLKHYFKCPGMFDNSLKYDALIGTATQNLFDKGNLFEGYVLGFKPDKDEELLIGRKKSVTIDPLRAQAAYVKPMFKSGDPYVKLFVETNDYALAGEADHIGLLDWDYINNYQGKVFFNNAEKSINDLKWTGSIPYVWSAYQKKQDYIQACMYVYMNFKMTGEVLPFFYIIVENTFDRPIIKIRRINIHESDFEWLEDFIWKVHNDLFLRPHASYESCEGGKKGGRCMWLTHCTEGRNYIGQGEIIDFATLDG